VSSRFPHLFAPLKLNHVTLRNRIVFGAHTANMSEGGLPGERHLHYYRERALGGAAMIVVEPVPVHRTGVLTRGNFRHDDDAIVPHFRRITDACHAEGAVMIHQLYHVGQHGDADNSFESSWSPSGLPSFHDAHGSHAMSEAEIEEVIAGFVRAAVRAREAGFDGVEIFAAYHALVDQFWTPWSNRRDDRWGGSFENRMRFSAEVLGGIRKAVGPDFVIGLAVSADPDVPVALSTEELQAVVAWHDERGLFDYVTCGTGSYFDFTKIIPTVVYADKLGEPFADALKQVVKHGRVQAESHIRTPENAEYIVASGEADMVSIVRGQIADPHLARKAAEDRPEDVRPCISCNQMCWGRRYRDYWISCLVNPSSGREYEWGGDRFVEAPVKKQVVVVGGGPAGLECARVAAERGHEVVLHEATDRLGGQFRFAGMQPRRAQILDLIAWYELRLEKLGVEVRCGSYVEADDLARDGADVLVVATGSRPDGAAFQRALPQFDRLPGIDRGNVFPVEDVMARRARCGRRVLVLDDIGHWHALGTAWQLAEAGHEVTVVTAHPMLGFELVRTSADIPLRRRLAAAGVRDLVENAVAEWHGDGAEVLDLRTGRTRQVAADTLVYATCNRSEDSLVHELRARGIEARAIGDCVAPRYANNAIFEGRRLGLSL